MRLIDADAACEYLKQHKKIARENLIILAANEDAIITFINEKCPTVDAEPVRHGRWEFDAEKYEWNCPFCHDWPIDGSADDERTYYCPNCGAKMDDEHILTVYKDWEK